MHSTCMLALLWMTKSSSRFMLILSAIYGKTQISSLSCTINVRWPSGSIFAILGHLSKLEMISLNYLAMSVHLHGEVQWTYHFELSGMFVIPSFVYLLKVVLLLFWRFLVVWWISLQHPLDFRSSNLDQICDINVCESHIGLRSRALLFSDDQHFSVSLQDISRGVCGVFQPLFDCYSWSDSCISRMGGLCHLDKWFRTIGPCVF